MTAQKETTKKTEYDRALAAYTQALKAFNKKDYEKAKESYLKAIELDPQNAGAHLRLGEIYMLTNNKEEAEKEFQIYQQLTAAPANQ